MDPTRSFLLTVELGSLPHGWGQGEQQQQQQLVPEVLGWEANAAGRFAPR
jgi:hypothetical protein